MKKFILASLLCALSGMGTANAQAQSASRADNMQKENKMSRPSMAHMNSYEGMWQGMLRTPEGSRRVLLDVAQRPDGKGLTGSMVTSAQSPYSVLVDRFSVQDRHIALDMKIAGSAFEGTSNRALTEIKGTWTYQGKSMPLTLKRMNMTTLSNNGNAYGSQSQVAGMSRSADDGETPPASKRRNDPVFRIGPPRWFPWYEWTPRPGNQDVPYGTHYW